MSWQWSCESRGSMEEGAGNELVNRTGTAQAGSSWGLGWAKGAGGWGSHSAYLCSQNKA